MRAVAITRLPMPSETPVSITTFGFKIRTRAYQPSHLPKPTVESFMWLLLDQLFNI